MLSRLNLTIIVAVLALLCARPAAAQGEQPPSQTAGLRLPTTLFATAAAADWATTYYGIKHFQLRETNPLIRKLDRSPGKMVLLGAAIDVGAVTAWNYAVGRKHPRIAAAGLWTMTAFRAYLAYHNSRNMQRSQRR